MSEAEPRRSVRATKGQHQHRDLDDIPPRAPKQRQTRKGGRNAAASKPTARGARGAKAAGEDEDEDDEEEVIRCVCGATSQDEDSDVAWIACDKCGVWQHNVCMDISTYDEDIPDKYSCEKCDPKSHTVLLEGLARGEKPWEERQQKHEVEKVERKKRRGGRKSFKKRISDPKSVLAAAADSSPAPPDTPSEKLEAKAAIGKRKAKDHDNKDAQAPALKLRKTSPSAQGTAPGLKQEASTIESPVVEATSRMTIKPPPELHHGPQAEPRFAPPSKPQPVSGAHEAPSAVAQSTYEPPADLAKAITDLPENRQGTASLLSKSFSHALEQAAKAGTFAPTDRISTKSTAVRLALEVERALHDVCAPPKEYTAQARTLVFNVKRNLELTTGLLRRTLSPTILAHMKSEQLASKEFQKEIQGIREKVEKQSIRITTDVPPRTRHTHKGEELVDTENFLANEEAPSVIRRASVREPASATPTSTPQLAGTQQSPRASDFDLTKVLSSVKSPTNAHPRRTSSAIALARGPGEDADIDRMLQGDADSPPYSPMEEDHDHDLDGDVVWRGQFTMSTLADFPFVAKWAAGANLHADAGMPWSELFNSTMGVIGRIEVDKATPYLCGLRYSNRCDLVVTSIKPATAGYEDQFRSVVNYFTSGRRFGVLDSKGRRNVQDAYLVPVPTNEDEYPEFLLNLWHNLVPPQPRSEPELLAVFVYKDAGALWGSAPGAGVGYSAPPTEGTPTDQQPGPLVSPTTPHPGNHTSIQQAMADAPGAATTRDMAHHTPPALANGNETRNGHGHAHSTPPLDLPPPPAAGVPASIASAQSIAQSFLGPELVRASTLPHILANCQNMTAKEWEVIRILYEKDPRTRDDLGHLSAMIARRAKESEAEPEGS